MKNYFIKGMFAAIALLSIYFVLLILLSGWEAARHEFLKYWYYTVSLAIGFGIQVGLYFQLKSLVKKSADPKVLMTTGTTSTAAMISCCSHYVVNFIPIIGAAGIVSIIAQYQVQFFWLGLAFNFAGIVYIYSQYQKHKKML